jgi:hypothetical protein
MACLAGPSQNRWLCAPVSTRRTRGMVRTKSSACAKATPRSWRDAVTSVAHGTERRTDARYADRALDA